MRLGLERLLRHQLGRALSPDGVWLENSFGYHCLIMNQLAMLLTDLRLAGVPEAQFIRDALARMLPFAEGLIKVDGSAPLIGDTAPGRHLSTIAAARREIALADGQDYSANPTDANFTRAAATYYFREGGYFASHTGRDLSAKDSSVIFTATLRNPKHKQSDDLSIIFSRGVTDLLVDGGTFNKEISDSVRNAARYDPASHNTFRVNNGGYPLVVVPGTSLPGGLNGMWEGPGWAAVRGFNHAYPDARLTRTVIHLKDHHAVLVLDILASKTSSEVLFEQFWHVSPDFPHAESKGRRTLVFNSKSDGVLLASFEENGPAPLVEFGSWQNTIAWMMQAGKGVVPTPYIRRAITCQNAVMASIFQWAETAGDLAISFDSGKSDRLELTAQGVDFTARFIIDQKEIARVALEKNPMAEREFA